MQSENIRKEKEKNNNTTVVLDKNGERTNNASYKNSRPESFNGIFFNENNLELNRFLYHGENFTHAFSGVARAQSSWDERQQSHVVLKKSTEGMRYATGALVVKNGVSAIAETYGKNISQKIILINKEIETLRVEIKHNKIEQAVVAEKNKISDVDFILKDFHLNILL